MRILYWNCTSPGLGGGSVAWAKKDMIGEVVRAVDPDVVCLDEMSVGVSDTLGADSYAINVLDGPGVAFETAVVVVNPGVHLNSVTWVKEGYVIKNAASGLPSSKWNTDKTKRDLTRIKATVGTKEAIVWFLHANASASGGKAAARLADTNADDTRNVFVGDFNCPIGDAQGAVAPAVNGHNFTQWKRDEHGKRSVPGRNPPMKYDPHAIIDYAICDRKKITIAAVDAVGGHELADFIRSFDHFPVAYELT